MLENFVEPDGISCSKKLFMIIHHEKFFLNHYSDFQINYEEYVGQQLLSAIITYDEMRTNYSKEVLDILFQDHFPTPT